MTTGIEIIIKELKQQHEWRKEESGCGNCEVQVSWEKVKDRLISDIKRSPTFDIRLIKAIQEA